MKKILIFCASTLFLTACADKQEYEQAVLEQMKTEKDLIDYNIEPEHMRDCVVDLSSEGMPGAFPLDPVRLTSYQNYTKMLSMSTVEDKQGMLEELRTIFGSPTELAAAHSNYTKSVMDCMAAIIMESEEAAKADDVMVEEVEVKEPEKAKNSNKEVLETEKNQGS